MFRKFLRSISWTILFFSGLFFLLLVYVIFIKPESSKQIMDMWSSASQGEKRQFFRDLLSYVKYLLIPLGAIITLWITRKKKTKRRAKRQKCRTKEKYIDESKKEFKKESETSLSEKALVDTVEEYKSRYELGIIGEENVASVLKKLPNGKYKAINDVVLIEGRRSVNIDHILVSTYGIVVIETKNIKDIVYGYERMPYWQQETLWSQEPYDFYNPIWQNRGHIKFLKKLIPFDVPYLNLVVFAGECELRGDIGINSNVIKLNELSSRLDELSELYDDIISIVEVDEIYKFLNDRNVTDKNLRKAHIERVKNIKRKYSDDPNLGEFLIKLNTRYEERDEVKRRGAWWSEGKKAWYISEQNDLSFFKKWLPNGVNVYAWNPFYICGGTQKCWKCKKEIQVISFASDNYRIVIDGELKEGFRDFKIFSEIEYMDQIMSNNEFKKILKKYFPESIYKYKEFTNYCCYCGRPQKDFYLHNKQGGVFHFEESSDISKINFLEVPLDFAVGLRVKEYQQFKLIRDKLQIISLERF